MLDTLVAERGESLAALSRMLGRNDAYLQQFVRRGTPRRLDERDRRLLAAYLGTDEVALGAPTPALTGPTTPVRLLDVSASAGPGRLVDEEGASEALPFDRAMLARLGIRSARLAMLRADGDSMAPGIEHGDQIMVDEADTRVGARGGVYVIRVDGTLMVKRIARRGAVMTITSDNPDFPAVPPRNVGEVEVLGKVVWLSRSLR